MRSIITAITALAVVAASCGGGEGGGGGQPQTEAGALEAVTTASEGALRGNVGAVLNFLSKECREAVDPDEVRLAVRLIPAFFGDLFEDFDIGDIEIEASIVSYDGDTARVSASYLAPDGTSIDTLGFSSETVTVEYEDGKWVDTGCDFEDTTARDAERLDEALATLGYDATRDDPIPGSVAAPVGEGFVVSVDAVDTDAAATLEELGGFFSELEVGEQLVLITMTVGFEGPNEPQPLSDVDLQVIGGSSSTGIDSSFGCSGFPSHLSSKNVKLFRGGVIAGDVCVVVPSAEIAGMQVAVEGGFGADRKIIFDPSVVADTPVPVTGASGPAPDGEYTASRTAPTPLGTPVVLGEGWTITVAGFRDATAELVAASDFNDPPPDGFVYGLLEYELAYDGDDQSASGFSVDVDVVGDSNVSADTNCGVSGLPDEIDRFAEVFKGGTVSGNQCFVVRAGDVDSLVAFASANFFDENALVMAVR